MALSIATADFSVPIVAVPFFTAGPTAQYVVVKATVTNTDTVRHTMTLYRVGIGGVVGTLNTFGADALQIPGLQTIKLPISGQGLIDGQTLQAVADVAAVLNLNITLAQVA